MASLRDAGFRGDIRSNEPLAPCTTWRIGGPADVLATPLDADDLRVAIRWAAGEGIPRRLLGNGSNLLVRDEGVRGLVIRLRRTLDAVAVDGTRIEAGAGASFPAIAHLAASRGLAGLEFAAGIPGTVGGAIVMNAGWHEHETGNVVAEVRFLDARGDACACSSAEARFAYRGSRFRDSDSVVLGAVFELRPDAADDVRERMDRFAVSRKANQPTDQPSCGSVFLKPAGGFAGRLIEQAGLKGARVGDAQVSAKHANFIVNVGRASAADVLALVEHIEDEVERRFGVRLVREFETW